MFLFELYHRYTKMVPMPKGSEGVLEKKRYERFSLHPLATLTGTMRSLARTLESALQDESCGAFTEVYVVLPRERDGVERGVYHYDGGFHGLREIPAPKEVLTEFLTTALVELYKEPYALLIITGIPDSAITIYGEHTYPLMLQDGGSVEGRLVLAGKGEGLALSPHKVSEANIASLLDFSLEHEFLLQVLAVAQQSEINGREGVLHNEKVTTST